MDLKSYLAAERGRGAELARALGVSPVMVSQWATETKQVPAERCPAIERATGGLVRCEELRDDVDWRVLREPPVPSVVTSTPPDAAAATAPVARAVGEPCTAIEITVAESPVACDDPQLVEGSALLTGEPGHGDAERRSDLKLAEKVPPEVDLIPF